MFAQSHFGTFVCNLSCENRFLLVLILTALAATLQQICSMYSYPQFQQLHLLDKQHVLVLTALADTLQQTCITYLYSQFQQLHCSRPAACTCTHSSSSYTVADLYSQLQQLDCSRLLRSLHQRSNSLNALVMLEDSPPHTTLLKLVHDLASTCAACPPECGCVS